MLILPIANNKRIMSVQVSLAGATKIKENVHFEDADESDIIVNREKFSDSSFRLSKDVNAAAQFVRSRSILHPRSYLITTKERSDSDKYDVYAVEKPPYKVDDSLDSLYSAALTDMRKEIPGKNKGKYISFKKMGIGSDLSNDKIAEVQNIVKNYEKREWPKLFEERGVANISETIDFINNFDYTILTDTVIPEDSLQEVLNGFQVIKTRDFKNLNNYYDMAMSNAEIFTRLSYLNKLINERPLAVTDTKRSKEKRLVKSRKNEEKKIA